MSYETILLERRGPAAWLTLNRPAELNAMDPCLIREVGQALSTIEPDVDVSCLVVTGAGRAFCAGADLKFVEAMVPLEREAATAEFLRDASALMSRLEAFPKPVIAAVNGIATAGGMELLLCCDLVYAADDARVGDGHANFGLLPGAGASVRLPRKIGITRANHLFFTGDLVPAGDLVAAGLINGVVPAADLPEVVAALAAKLAARSPLGIRLMKDLAATALDLSQADGLARELAVNHDYAASFDRNEGLAAFKERRRPMFQGR